MTSRNTILIALVAVAAFGASTSEVLAQGEPSAPPPAKAAPLDTAAKPATETSPDGKSDRGTAMNKGNKAKKPRSRK